jgi:hypothetical protein
MHLEIMPRFLNTNINITLQPPYYPTSVPLLLDMNIKSGLYTTLAPYQTRLLCLHGANHDLESVLVCTLYVADILHPSFEGLGVRSCNTDESHLRKFEALSYVWGSQEDLKQITCNKVSLSVTKNLFEALMALRDGIDEDRYLWVDAICINQNDSAEKAFQVRNMLTIYEKAVRVIAWLGPLSNRDLTDVLSEGDFTPSPSMNLRRIPSWEKYIDVFPDWIGSSSRGRGRNPLDLEEICATMRLVYSLTYFKRIWIQQEVFAARELRLQSGQRNFEWKGLLSQPDRLYTLPQICEDQTPLISEIVDFHANELSCFDYFRQKQEERPYLIDTLLYTGRLKSTDTRDYVYGILGLTSYPSKSMSIKEWEEARRSSLFIPVDYSTTWDAVTSAVTWVTLMTEGLALIAKFKILDAKEENSTLPSWAIDWRITARCFRRRRAENKTVFGHRSVLSRGSLKIPSTSTSSLKTSVREHNTRHTMSWKKIILHGIVDTRFYVSNDHIWERRRHLKDKRRWQLSCDTNGDDIVVYMPEVLGSEIEQELLGHRLHEGSEASHEYTSGGLWLLRSVGNNEHRIIACLSWIPMNRHVYFNHWQRQIEDDRYRPLAVDLGNAAIDHLMEAPRVIDWDRRQKFTIV